MGSGVAHAGNDPTGNRVTQRTGDIDQRFLAVKRTIANRGFAARFEFGSFRHEIDDPAQRALPEQHRGRTADQLDLVEIIGIGADARIIAENVAHAVAELQRVDAAHQGAVDAAVRTVGIGRHASDIVQRVADADRALGEIEFVVDHRDRLRRLDDGRVGLGGGAGIFERTGDNDRPLLEIVRCAFGERGQRRQSGGPQNGNLQKSHHFPSHMNLSVATIDNH